jgi:quercetin dioxygenase-like cupin family protein
MSYTIKNLRDVKDSAPEFGMGDAHAARFATEALDAEQTGVSLLTVKPGKRMPFGHRHDEAEEVYVVVSGSGRLKLDDEIVEIGPLDAIRLAPSVMRAAEAGPDGLEYVAFGARHQGDGAMDPGFWPA